ncbi:MAG: hypothetical protein K8I82_10255 [Anaerolineae bacterium]|nr:hypothetical protein [Anaerolineae bacterium]
MISPMTSLEAQLAITFDNFVLSGMIKRLAKQATGRSSRLQGLYEMTQQRTVENRYDLGFQVVPIKKIKGSVDKTSDFDSDFHPTRQYSRDRWVKIAQAIYDGKSLPPVELIQVGDVYYVVDGHHRISVARAMKQPEIDAIVTVWTLRPTTMMACCTC